MPDSGTAWTRPRRFHQPDCWASDTPVQRGQHTQPAVAGYAVGPVCVASGQGARLAMSRLTFHHALHTGTYAPSLPASRIVRVFNIAMESIFFPET